MKKIKVISRPKSWSDWGKDHTAHNIDDLINEYLAEGWEILHFNATDRDEGPSYYHFVLEKTAE
jgi:hypothetical protein